MYKLQMLYQVKNPDGHQYEKGMYSFITDGT